jgi:plastocyanin
MSYRTHFMALALGLLLAASASAQYDGGGGPSGGDPRTAANCVGVAATITISGETFTPATVTIDAGQPVCWNWSASMQHNVYADDGSFSSGPAANTGTFQRTFTTPGTYGFYCQVHGSLTGGMRGTIIVNSTTTGGDGGGGGGDTGPATVGLSASTYSVTEGAGALTVTVTRTGVSTGKATVKYATAPGTAKAVKDYTTRAGVLSWAAGDASPKTIQIPIKNDSVPEPDKTFSIRLSKATGAALGTAAAVVTIHDDDNPGCGVTTGAVPGKLRLVDTTEGLTTPCDDANALCLGNGRFEATVQWRPSTAGGDKDSKRAQLPETAGSGLFTPSPQEEPQLLLNVLDRCSVNGHYWLSLAAVTDLDFIVKVRDTQTGRTRVYLNPAGSTPASLRDVEAFGACP